MSALLLVLAAEAAFVAVVACAITLTARRADHKPAGDDAITVMANHGIAQIETYLKEAADQ